MAHRIITLTCLLAAGAMLAACSGTPGTTVVVREGIDGKTRFLSRTLALPGRARFECVASDSGQCHYAVFGGRCGVLAAGFAAGLFECGREAAPIARFDLKVGERRDVGGLPMDFRHCVRERPSDITAGCLAPGRELSAWRPRRPPPVAG